MTREKSKPLSSEDSVALAKAITEFQSNQNQLTPKTSVLIPLGAVAGIVTALCTPIWMVSAYNSEFREMQKNEQRMASRLELAERRLEWFKVNFGNTKNRWTPSMAMEAHREFAKQNNLKEIDLRVIHENNSRWNEPDPYPQGTQ